MGDNTKRDSTARSRELGAELRKRREAAHLQGVDIARKLGWSQTKISRMETGDRAVSEVDLAIYLTFCGVHGDELAALMRMARETGDEGYWRQPHDPRLPEELHALAHHERTASEIQSYEPLLIPGLIQTEDYARALFEWVRLVPDNGVEPRIRARMERQRLLNQWDPPQITFYLHQNAVRTPVGEPHVMHEQLLNLLFVSSRPQLELRIVPDSAGPHGALQGSFMLMQYTQHRPVVYRETLTDGAFLERDRDIDMYKVALARLAEIALDGEESRMWVAHLANEYEQQKAGPE